jgi:phosphoserine phosphatase RsbU/P
MSPISEPMKILIAEDDEVSRRILHLSLAAWGHEVLITRDGAEAWALLAREDAPPLAILDWMMPHMDGLEVCWRVRQRQTTLPTYLILLTAKGGKTDIVQGLDAGANDYIVKPFDRDELRARVQVGARVVELQQSLAERVLELEEALMQVKQLQGILPICSYCKNVRNDQNYWQQVESYVSEHSAAKFSHSICPTCYEAVVKPQLEQRRSEHEAAALINPARTER